MSKGRNSEPYVIHFRNISKIQQGRVITAFDAFGGTNAVIFTNNPYGGHGLILGFIGENDPQMESYKHGNHAVLDFLFRFQHIPAVKRSISKTLRFLTERGFLVEKLPFRESLQERLEKARKRDWGEALNNPEYRERKRKYVR